jgi:anti-sigma regulatory factor (Ser/Thr protein kinase)
VGVVRNYRRRFASAYESVGIARREIVAFAAANGFAGAPLDDIESAVGEALANAAEHGHREGGDIAIHARVTEREIIIDIEDRGPGFARWNASDYLRPLGTAARGFGIFLMRELMDRVEYSAHGARIRLVKYFPASRTD